MTTRLLVIGLLAAVSILPAAHLEAVDAAKSHGWRVKYNEGTITIEERHDERDLSEGSRLRVVIEKNRIVVSRKKKNILTVPVAEVTQVSYHHVDNSRSKQVFRQANVLDAIGGCDQGALLCAAMALPLYAATAPFVYRDHFVRIAWRSGNPESGEDEGFDEDVEFQVGRRDWSAFLTELATVTGKRWKDESPQTVVANKLRK